MQMGSVSQARPGADPCKVMIVDDSAVVRAALTRMCEADPGIKVVATAVNGLSAIATLKRSDVDVMLLDIEMPVMDGLTALPELVKIAPKTKILMSSTLTLRNAEISMKALSLGAADYVAKPTSMQDSSGLDMFQKELIAKIRILVARSLPKAPSGLFPSTAAYHQNDHMKLRPVPTRGCSAVVIGSSTGGPQALMELMKGLKDLTKPIFITQHMPPKFTTALAHHLTGVLGRKVDEAVNDQEVTPSGVYLAPGDFHMRIVRSGTGYRIKLDQGPKENSCRPSVDPMFSSVSDAYAGHVLAVMLTGMGSDGLKGTEHLVRAGGALIAQDEKTSVVWGMPGAVSVAGLASAILPLTEIARTLCTYAGLKVR